MGAADQFSRAGMCRACGLSCLLGPRSAWLTQIQNFSVLSHVWREPPSVRAFRHERTRRVNRTTFGPFAASSFTTPTPGTAGGDEAFDPKVESVKSSSCGAASTLPKENLKGVTWCPLADSIDAAPSKILAHEVLSAPC